MYRIIWKDRRKSNDLTEQTGDISKQKVYLRWLPVDEKKLISLTKEEVKLSEVTIIRLICTRNCVKSLSMNCLI